MQHVRCTTYVCEIENSAPEVACDVALKGSYCIFVLMLSISQSDEYGNSFCQGNGLNSQPKAGPPGSSSQMLVLKGIIRRQSSPSRFCVQAIRPSAHHAIALVFSSLS